MPLLSSRRRRRHLSITTWRRVLPRLSRDTSPLRHLAAPAAAPARRGKEEKVAGDVGYAGMQGAVRMCRDSGCFRRPSSALHALPMCSHRRTGHHKQAALPLHMQSDYCRHARVTKGLPRHTCIRTASRRVASSSLVDSSTKRRYPSLLVKLYENANRRRAGAAASRASCSGVMLVGRT